MDIRFNRHSSRSVVDLSGMWDFAFLGDKKADAVKPDRIRFNDQMVVPGCFDATPAYAGKRGLAAYRTTVQILDKTPHRLWLDGVHHWCRVFAGGKKMLDHAGGFTRFAVDLIGFKTGPLEIIVLVDNRFGPQSPLHLEYFDWYHFGGIARPPELHRLGETWIEDVTVTTTDYRSREVELRVECASTAAGSAPLTVTFGGKRMLKEKVDFSVGGWTVTGKFKLEGAQLWSPDNPALHELRVQLGDDDWIERVGIRQVQVRGKKILINGKATRLLGFCRHEAHPQFGHSIPESLMLADIQQLKDMGCNFIRGSHYPQDRRFLDLCDRLGMLVWCETIGWGQNVQQLLDEAFVAGQMLQGQEMVKAARNHACVIMWGVLNEGPSDAEQAKPVYRQLLANIRQLDPSRPLTFASNRWRKELCFDLADIVSINMYPGWYSGNIESIPQRLDEVMEKLRELGQQNKPFLVSEIGGGAIYGWRDTYEARWTEQYQARLLDTALRTLFVDRQIAQGISIWQFCDMRTSQDPVRSITRPRAFNNKGVVDEYRRPKQAYDVVKNIFKQIGTKG